MKLIDKDALVVEIERLKNIYKKCPTRNSYDEGLKAGRLIGYQDALHKINTLEAKEVDLEKFTEKINTFQARYKHPEITSIKGTMAFMARMFYQYPNVAREWYESLPKATMD